MNTLWLIGIWERSRASKTIKLLCGNTGCCGVGLFTVRLPHRRRPGRRAGVHQSARPLPTTRASGWPATWFPTTWASIRPGWWSIPSGSSRDGSRPTRRTASMAPISPPTGAWRSRLTTTTTPRRTPRSCFSAATNPAAKRATSTTATTAPAFPGTTRRSSIT